MFLLASAATSSVTVLLALRVLAGASGAVSFIVGGALATQLGHGKAPARSALLLGTGAPLMTSTNGKVTR